MKRSTLPLILTLIALPAAAHEGVKDPQVLARMNVMETIGKQMGTLGGMAKGEVAFDADVAAAAKATLEKASAQVLPTFEPPATDPHSEAAPAIWEEWDGFTTQSVAMDAAIAALDTSSLETLRAGLGGIGQTCRTCHKAYRIKK